MAAMMATERLWRMTRPGPEPVARNAVSWRPMPVLRRPVEPAPESDLIVRAREMTRRATSRNKNAVSCGDDHSAAKYDGADSQADARYI